AAWAAAAPPVERFQLRAGGLPDFATLHTLLGEAMFGAGAADAALRALAEERKAVAVRRQPTVPPRLAVAGAAAAGAADGAVGTGGAPPPPRPVEVMDFLSGPMWPVSAGGEDDESDASDGGGGGDDDALGLSSPEGLSPQRLPPRPPPRHSSPQAAARGEPATVSSDGLLIPSTSGLRGGGDLSGQRMFAVMATAAAAGTAGTGALSPPDLSPRGPCMAPSGWFGEELPGSPGGSWSPPPPPPPPTAAAPAPQWNTAPSDPPQSEPEAPGGGMTGLKRPSRSGAGLSAAPSAGFQSANLCAANDGASAAGVGFQRSQTSPAAGGATTAPVAAPTAATAGYGASNGFAAARRSFSASPPSTPAGPSQDARGSTTVCGGSSSGGGAAAGSVAAVAQWSSAASATAPTPSEGMLRPSQLFADRRPRQVPLAGLASSPAAPAPALAPAAAEGAAQPASPPILAARSSSSGTSGVKDLIGRFDKTSMDGGRSAVAAPSPAGVQQWQPPPATQAPRPWEAMPPAQPLVQAFPLQQSSPGSQSSPPSWSDFLAQPLWASEA
ncbi:unnamed protein product, partial [Phaeothamnion confervicola]